MIRTARRILKSEDIELQGQYRLEVPQGGVATAAVRQKGVASGPARACVLEKQPDHVLIEVTCSCGSKIILKCDYAGTQTPGNPQTQKGVAATPSQTK